MRKGAFSFCDVDMYERYGVLVSNVDDQLMPALRPRKVIVPDRSGAFDYGAKYRDERIITLECGTITTVSRSDIREFAYSLSHKGPLRLWDEEDKYYMGRIYDPDEIIRRMERFRQFTLSFVCDPYAYGRIVEVSFRNSADWTYGGTAPTQAVITIYNPGTKKNGITITKREKQEL